jgi:hypothetical protein
VSAGASGSVGTASGAWVKSNADMSVFCAAFSVVSGGRPHRACMNFRSDTFVVCWWNTPFLAYGLMMIIGVLVP